MVKETLRIGALVVLILAALFLKAYLVAPKHPFVNWASELIGIVVTVFLIARIIDWREERSWRPAKRVIHRKVLTEIIEPFLDSSSCIVQDMVNRKYWDTFPDIKKASSNLRSRTRKEVANPPKDKINELLDTSGLLLERELYNKLQTLDAQLTSVLEEERNATVRLETQAARSPDQAMAALEPLLECIRKAAGTARQTKLWLENDLKRDEPRAAQQITDS